MKYLKVSVSGPYINTDRVSYIPVADDFVKDGEADQKYIEDQVWEYVESWSELVDEDQVPEDER
ncbi:hypothetical protein P1P75_01275 [Streptomyces sp. ID05-39B]|uniref:hypothetical protein n=1 Tax=Streptomyces sp. ID05-39B TaxID=3028664 RepID=UPI0029A1B53C|nr:hypothetical protein [Streptomyces sp. ID05-39B]MDX3525112.1 hypothetical protein [Streptomyces sp. ID05-39B]